MNCHMTVELAYQLYFEAEVTFLNKIIQDRKLPEKLRLEAAEKLNQVIEFGCGLSKQTGFSFLPYAYNEARVERVEA